MVLFEHLCIEIHPHSILPRKIYFLVRVLYEPKSNIGSA